MNRIFWLRDFSKCIWLSYMQVRGYFILIYFSLFPTRPTVLFRLRTISAILFPLYVSGLTGPSSEGLNCTCSLWYSPPLQMSLLCGRWERTWYNKTCRLKHVTPRYIYIKLSGDNKRDQNTKYTVSFLNGRTTKTSAEGENTIGCMYNLDLLMMGLWGLKHVEERG